MSKVDLDKLAAAGRGQEQGEQFAASAEQARDTAKVMRRLLRRARLSCSPLYAFFKYSVFAFAGVAALGGVVVLKDDPLHVGTLGCIALCIPVALVPPALIYLGAWLQGGPRFAREQAWLAGLPFPLERHLETLGYFDDGGAISGRHAVTLKIRFAGPTPVEQLADACRGFDGRVKPAAHARQNELHLERDDLLSDDTSNHRYYRWIHSMASGLLLELAARHPIRTVLVYSRHLGRTTKANRGIYEEY